jgi:AcrR family transcriptional regulator
MDPATLLSPKPALQKRSEATLAAIVQATLDLLATKDIEEIAVSEIAQKAGVAVGTIYRRFENKEALVAHLLQLVQGKQVTELGPLLRAPEWEGAGIEQRVRWLREQLTATAQRAPGLIRAIFAHVITGRDPLADYSREQDGKVLRLLTEWLLDAHPGDPGAHEHAVTATALATFVHAVYMAVLYPFSYPGQPRGEVVEQLESGLLAHLRTAWP